MDATVAWPLRRAARVLPDGEALVDGATRRSWADVHRRLSCLAAGLDDLGIARGDRVAVLAHNSANHLEAWLALPAHGWVINDLNLRLAASELAFMVDDSECTALLVDDDHLETGRELMDSCPSLRRLVYIGYLPEAPQDAVAWEEGFRADAVAEAIERERITLTLLVPTMIGMLLDHVERHPRDLSSLRLLMYAASPMPKETQRRAMAALGLRLHADVRDDRGCSAALPSRPPRITGAARPGSRRTWRVWTPPAPRSSACSARCATRLRASRFATASRERYGYAAQT